MFWFLTASSWIWFKLNIWWNWCLLLLFQIDEVDFVLISVLLPTVVLGFLYASLRSKYSIMLRSISLSLSVNIASCCISSVDLVLVWHFTGFLLHFLYFLDLILGIDTAGNIDINVFLLRLCVIGSDFIEFWWLRLAIFL